ncbi:hypothetical protein I8748_05620 [Nostoc sp. CENA67]|uniref:Uncharacterized protein n=1 Tax=Amazonocrinis nigriterrae CENA67 TaxID=2794033 RepID=A0A8J7HQQ8_9NOST|nr:hypothetical protein [Amazonocrinis nigriterrae]MBH8561662.1 hypothetical protein [Amazonocrinis nigriterrae CENA67]
MDSFSPMNYYQQQAITAAAELDYELELAAAEAENTEDDSVQPSPQPENSVYNFNAILDGLLD